MLLFTVKSNIIHPCEYSMLEKKKEYIDLLLSDLKRLEDRILAIKNEEAIPFSFFRESFDRAQEIVRLLHELEIQQIEEMKHQMERLVLFLSESENNVPSTEQPVTGNGSFVNERQEPRKEETPEEFPEPVVTQEIITNEETEEDREESVASWQKQSHTEEIILPEYRNPRATESDHSRVRETISYEKIEMEKTVIRSLNDRIQSPSAFVDSKRSISLNDRFLFQRELFDNSRHKMDDVMIKLNAFHEYEDAEAYLREHTSWNFDDPTVKDFLQAIKKGFG